MGCELLPVETLAMIDQRAQLSAAIKLLVQRPEGFGVELYTDLWITNLEDGRFSVARTYGTMQFVEEELFDDVNLAVEHYITTYERLQVVSAADVAC